MSLSDHLRQFKIRYDVKLQVNRLNTNDVFTTDNFLADDTIKEFVDDNHNKVAAMRVVRTILALHDTKDVQ